MIYGETIKSAFATRLLELFPDVKVYKEKIEPTEEMKNTLTLLSGVVLCEEGKISEGKEILSEILPNLNFELTKQIVLNYTV